MRPLTVRQALFTLAAVAPIAALAVACSFTLATRDELSGGNQNCNTDTTRDPLNCGACGVVCPGGLHIQPTCTAGICGVACETGWADCANPSAPKNCSVDLRTTVDSCGACGRTCVSGGAHTVPTTTAPVCTDGRCTSVCEASWGDCDQLPENGCEALLAQDPKNCGRCGHDCLGGQCAASSCKPLVLASNLIASVGIAADDTIVAFSDRGWIVPPDGGVFPGRIGAVNADGGTRTLAATQPYPTRIAVDSTHVYFANWGSLPDLTDSAKGSIFRIGKDGTCPNSTVCPEPVVAQTPFPLALAVDTISLYWLDGNANALMRIGKDKTGLVILRSANSPKGGLIADTSGVVWTEPGAAPGGWIYAVPPGGGTRSTLAADQDEPCGVASDETFIYWANAKGRQIRRVPRNGGAVEDLAMAANSPCYVAVDASDLYATVDGPSAGAGGFDGSLVRVPKKGCGSTPNCPEVLATGFNSVPLALDSRAVYITTTERILKIAK